MFSIPPLEIQILLFVFGIVGGIIGAISGGGGLLITPLLIFSGLSPVQAVATQNIYAVPLHLSATYKFKKNGSFPKLNFLTLIPVILGGGTAGAITISYLPSDFLKIFVPILLIVLSVWVVTNSSLESRSPHQRLSIHQYAFFILPFISFYDGFFGACSTTFYTLSCILLLNMSALEATAISKPFTAASSFAAILVFASNGNLMWAHGIILALGSVIGAQIGASLVIKHGVKLIRAVLVVTSIGASLKLLANQLW